MEIQKCEVLRVKAYKRSTGEHSIYDTRKIINLKSDWILSINYLF